HPSLLAQQLCASDGPRYPAHHWHTTAVPEGKGVHPGTQLLCQDEHPSLLAQQLCASDGPRYPAHHWHTT
ncbi:hypothetical protein PSZ77_24110, partial [Shigella sonnei]|nr:hypothetical protein [Shigella sonnei]